MTGLENGRYRKCPLSEITAILIWETVILVIIGEESSVVKSIPIWPRILSQNSHKVNCEV